MNGDESRLRHPTHVGEDLIVKKLGGVALGDLRDRVFLSQAKRGVIFQVYNMRISLCPGLRSFGDYNV